MKSTSLGFSSTWMFLREKIIIGRILRIRRFTARHKFQECVDTAHRPLVPQRTERLSARHGPVGAGAVAGLLPAGGRSGYRGAACRRRVRPWVSAVVAAEPGVVASAIHRRRWVGPTRGLTPGETA